MSGVASAGPAAKLRRLPVRLGRILLTLRNRVVDTGAPVLAKGLYRLSDRVAYVPFRREVVDLPAPLVLGERRADIVADLAEYTGLPEEEVGAALRRRRALSFRSEWWATPERLRRDHWFYLSSKSYLFGNASHFPDTSFAQRYVLPFVPSGGAVLDFGGGAGGLTLMLAAQGLRAWYTDVNALQRDFVRFRVRRHELEQRVTILDWWEELPRAGFDGIVAVDVLEHLPDGRAEVERLLGALGPKGVLVENSPFTVNAANPMHHDDFGLRLLLAERGFVLALEGEDGTCIWRRSSGEAA